MQLEQFERALEDFGRATLDVDLMVFSTYDHKGWAYAAQGRQERAIYEFDLAIRFDLGYPDAYQHRGLVYQKLGKTKEYERDFQKARELGYEGP